MVAIIKTGYGLSKSFRYNEAKLEKGLAECLLAGNYPCDPHELTSNQRLSLLLKLAQMNQNVKRNCIHITLNFHPDDSLSKKQLQEIARSYMDGIGFAGQPFLVYQHHDAGHVHLHLLSVIVRPDGRAIPIHNNARLQSERTRKQIESTHQLTPAQHGGQRLTQQHEPVPALKVTYGQNPTMSAISQVLDAVLPCYRYTCLAELNAVLAQYNLMVLAAITKSGAVGLRYTLLDASGKQIGVPIRASLFRSKPTYAYLKKRFLINYQHRRMNINRLKTAIDYALVKYQGLSVKQFGRLLQKEAVQIHLSRPGPAGKAELIYIDFRTKCVFAAADLGDSYTAARVSQRLQAGGHYQPKLNALRVEKDQAQSGPAPQGRPWSPDMTGQGMEALFIPILFEPVAESQAADDPLRKPRMKRRRKITPQR